MNQEDQRSILEIIEKGIHFKTWRWGYTKRHLIKWRDRRGDGCKNGCMSQVITLFIKFRCTMFKVILHENDSNSHDINYSSWS